MTATDFMHVAGIVVLLFSVGAMWYAQRALGRASGMLREAGDYWRRSSEIWDAIDAAPGENITEEALRKMQAFLDEETDQVGSIPSDYHRAKDTP